MEIESLEQGCYYHIFNRGINGTEIFKDKENYQHFLNLYSQYIDPVVYTFAWCLMGNHFHLLLYLKLPTEIDEEKLKYRTIQKPKTISPSRQFSHLFNSYSQAFNKKYNRTGSLFEKPFERKKVVTSRYFKQLIFYIHNNPVHHGFCDRLQDYPWSSYGSVISIQPTKLNRDEVLGYFDGVGNFISYHNQKQNLDVIEDLLIE